MKKRMIACLTAAVMVCAMAVPCLAVPGDSPTLPEAPTGNNSVVRPNTGTNTNNTTTTPVTAPVNNVTTATTETQTPVADAATPITQITSADAMQTAMEAFDAENANLSFEEKANMTLPNGLTYLENALNVIISTAAQNTDDMETFVSEFSPEAQSTINNAVEPGTTISDYVPMATFDVSSSMATTINADGSMTVEMEYQGIAIDSKLLVLNFHSDNTDTAAAAAAYAQAQSGGTASSLADIYNEVNVVPYTIPAENQLTLTFDKLSPVMILKLSDEGAAKAEAAAAGTTDTTTDTAEPEDSSSSFPWAAVIVVVIVLAGAGAYVYTKKKAKVKQ